MKNSTACLFVMVLTSLQVQVESTQEGGKNQTPEQCQTLIEMLEEKIKNLGKGTHPENLKKIYNKVIADQTEKKDKLLKALVDQPPQPPPQTAANRREPPPQNKKPDLGRPPIPNAELVEDWYGADPSNHAELFEDWYRADQNERRLTDKSISELAAECEKLEEEANNKKTKRVWLVVVVSVVVVLAVVGCVVFRRIRAKKRHATEVEQATKIIYATADHEQQLKTMLPRGPDVVDETAGAPRENLEDPSGCPEPDA